MADSATARHNMVESQIRTNKVTDTRLTAAMLEIPRERFLPKGLRGTAYIDENIPLGGGRHLMEPMVFARLLQIAEVQAGPNPQFATGPERVWGLGPADTRGRPNSVKLL